MLSGKTVGGSSGSVSPKQTHISRKSYLRLYKALDRDWIKKVVMAELEVYYEDVSGHDEVARYIANTLRAKAGLVGLRSP